ncbi:glycine receptor subunit alpha-2-like isoform X2 [Homarus americanus]|uniref:glycine receptor subunit alpha-2-like isoform X2 n=1 Tax=Homarus americanus TaxID=6706 RepID=UPI001C45A886|nr:glycine receptor subunit alpha-2-like isoform X2 [Homarus americanus]
MAGCPRLVRCLPGATTTLTLALLALLLPPAAHGETKGFTIDDIMPLDKSNYDKMRPPKKEGKATVVFFHVTVMGIDSINENSMTYAADIFFAQTWKDHRLRLPENMTTEYRLLDLDWLKHLWRPDSFFKNAKQVTFQTMTIPNHYVWLFQDSKILYMVKLTLKLSCAMNFAIYPHDTQECKLQMESCNFTCLEVVFRLKRRLGYYVFHTYIPTCLIVIMSWVSFWIKPEIAPARVTLGVTSLLTLFTQQAKSQASLPPVSYIKTIDIFMSSCTVFVFMALIEYAVVNIILGDGSGEAAKGPAKPEPKPSKATELAIKESRRFLLGEPPKPAGPSPAQIRRGRALMVDRVSRYLFPLSFALLNAVYWFSFRQYL